MKFLEDLAARRRFGMKPGLDSIRALCATLGDPQRGFRSVHVAGTNGKGAVCALVDASLRSAGFHTGRYTSPHLVKINERFFLDGIPVDDSCLERIAEQVGEAVGGADITFFEALTAVAFLLYHETAVDFAVLECGLGGRLDATNICEPVVSVITRIGLDHCDWLGDTVEQIAAEKAGIIRPGVPVVLGCNVESVVEVVRHRAEGLGAPFHYAPDLASESEIPSGFALHGSFNVENAITAIASLKVLTGGFSADLADGFTRVVWPGRFQRIGRFVVDGAHNPPAALALASAVAALPLYERESISLVAGFCGDKDVDDVLSILAPMVTKGFAVQTNNPRSLTAGETAAKMRSHGLSSVACDTLHDALEQASEGSSLVLICGSLFLAGEALVELGAYPWDSSRFDPSEMFKPSCGNLA